jgi:hypothetical protein
MAFVCFGNAQNRDPFEAGDASHEVFCLVEIGVDGDENDLEGVIS